MSFKAPVWFRSTDTNLTLGSQPNQTPKHVQITKFVDFLTGDPLTPVTPVLANRGDGQYLFSEEGAGGSSVLFTLTLVDEPTVSYEGLYEPDSAAAALATMQLTSRMNSIDFVGVGSAQSPWGPEDRSSGVFFGFVHDADPNYPYPGFDTSLWDVGPTVYTFVAVKISGDPADPEEIPLSYYTGTTSTPLRFAPVPEGYILRVDITSPVPVYPGPPPSGGPSPNPGYPPAMTYGRMAFYCWLADGSMLMSGEDIWTQEQQMPWITRSAVEEVRCGGYGPGISFFPLSDGRVSRYGAGSSALRPRVYFPSEISNQVMSDLSGPLGTLTLQTRPGLGCQSIASVDGGAPNPLTCSYAPEVPAGWAIWVQAEDSAGTIQRLYTYFNGEWVKREDWTEKLGSDCLLHIAVTWQEGPDGEELRMQDFPEGTLSITLNSSSFNVGRVIKVKLPVISKNTTSDIQGYPDRDSYFRLRDGGRFTASGADAATLDQIEASTVIAKESTAGAAKTASQAVQALLNGMTEQDGAVRRFTQNALEQGPALATPPEMLQFIETMNTMLEIDGATYRYTANALEQAPANIISGLTQAVYDYITGKVAKGTIIAPLSEAAVGKTLNIFQYTSYEVPGEVQINVGADWAPWLDGTYDPWFVASLHSTQPEPNMEVPCTIFDQANGVLKMALTVEDTSLEAGIYRWQIVLKTPDGVKVHVSAEGRLEIKSNLMKPAV